ncbi:MAG: hypothetical protein CL666_06220 [Balneola sp.]|nr:hypothetical protein [Balneola sp.]|tara:strand:- start:55085 stop:55867 length:783 start_codon:yes stop_codon:yes gene_type:complete
MKRIHLFEIEDLAWFPGWLRSCMTRLIIVMHRLVGTEKKVAELLNRLIEQTGKSTIVDYCSGSGGPMPDVLQRLKTTYGKDHINLVLSDLYPDNNSINTFNEGSELPIKYLTKPVDVTNSDLNMDGIRTMIGSFHHFKPKEARQILTNAQKAKQPILIFELSDNSTPIFLWWIAVPINFIMALCITPWAQPMTWKQLVFTYLIPIIPLCFAWDGAVSNVRTYTLDDLDELLEGHPDENYSWETGKFEGKTNQIYVLGYPK